MKTGQVVVVKQDNLSAECWIVQLFGLANCKTCEYRDTPECGGQQIRTTGKNELGHNVPLGEKRG